MSRVADTKVPLGLASCSLPGKCPTACRTLGHISVPFIIRFRATCSFPVTSSRRADAIQAGGWWGFVSRTDLRSSLAFLMSLRSKKAYGISYHTAQCVPQPRGKMPLHRYKVWIVKPTQNSSWHFPEPIWHPCKQALNISSGTRPWTLRSKFGAWDTLASCFLGYQAHRFGILFLTHLMSIMNEYRYSLCGKSNYFTVYYLEHPYSILAAHVSNKTQNILCNLSSIQPPQLEHSLDVPSVGRDHGI